jgi:hypothetical protein
MPAAEPGGFRADGQDVTQRRLAGGPGPVPGRGTVCVGQFAFPGVTDPQATGAVQLYYRQEDVVLGAATEAGPDSAGTMIGEILPTRPLARISLATDPPLTALILHRDLERLHPQAGDPVTAPLPRASVLAFPPAKGSRLYRGRSWAQPTRGRRDAV